MAECKYEGCKEEVFEDSDYCILHVDSKDFGCNDYRKIISKKKQKIEEKINNCDFNFEGTKLPKVQFQGINMPHVNFNFAEIEGDVWISGSTINTGITFRRTKINGDIYLGFTDVEGSISFSEAAITGNLTLVRVEIKSLKKEVLKNKYGITEDSDFNGSGFFGDIDFNETTIGGDLTLNDLKVAGFLEAVIADIKGDAVFKIEVQGNVGFYGSKIQGRGSFKWSKINLSEDLKRYKKDANTYYNDFSRLKIYGHADFSKLEFNKCLYFKKASFLGSGLFEGLDNFNASFEGAKLKNFVFRGCDLTDVKFKNVIFENCELSTSKWKAKIPEHKDYENGKSSAKVVADTYRRIRQSLQQQGAYDKAGIFYVEEMNMKKEVYWEENKGIWFIYNILSFTTGYGEKLVNILIIFVIYWIIYITAVYSMPENKLIIPIGSGFLSILTGLFVYVFARKMSR